MLLRSDLFAPEWYLEAYPDVRDSGTPPLTHYLVHGAGEGRNPSPNFDTQSCLDQHPELARSDTNPQVHYLKNRTRGFRTRHYAEAYCRISSYLQTMTNKGYNPLVAIQLALSCTAPVEMRLRWPQYNGGKESRKMSKTSRRKFTIEQRAAILGRHLVDKVSVSDLCDQYSLQPSVFYTR
jgi:hypothetical protein